MIPKIIHYCWFGKKDKPKKIKKCIASWKKFLPDYQIIEWNEDNFIIDNQSEYVKQAYYSKKYAFVSDVARLSALYTYGGIYFDTDVEVKKSFNDLLDNNQCIFGFEEENYIATSFIAAEQGNAFIKLFLDEYTNAEFAKNGVIDFTTNVTRITNLLKNYGLKLNGQYQRLKNNVTVYPQNYFSPYDYINFYNKSDENTYCIHYFHVTWMTLKYI